MAAKMAPGAPRLRIMRSALLALLCATLAAARAARLAPVPTALLETAHIYLGTDGPEDRADVERASKTHMHAFDMLQRAMGVETFEDLDRFLRYEAEAENLVPRKARSEAKPQAPTKEEIDHQRFIKDAYGEMEEEEPLTVQFEPLEQMPETRKPPAPASLRTVPLGG